MRISLLPPAIIDAIEGLSILNNLVAKEMFKALTTYPQIIKGAELIKYDQNSVD